MERINLILLGGFVFLNMLACIKSDGPVPPKDNQPPALDCSGVPGPLFAAVKNLINQKCVTCHNSGVARGGVSFSVECTIVSKKDRIKVRAVDESSMPPDGPLSQTEKNTITAWITAGGKYTN